MPAHHHPLPTPSAPPATRAPPAARQVAFSGRRSAEGERIMREIMGREWGLILLDEVGGWVGGWVVCQVPTGCHAGMCYAQLVCLGAGAP